MVLGAMPKGGSQAIGSLCMSCNEFVNAAERKVAIIDYHLICLHEAIAREPDTDPVPIPVQAHFEGILGSFAAGADQISAGLHAVTDVGDDRVGLGALLVEYEPKSGPLVALQTLWRSPERRDISEVRRRATHYYYDKYRAGESYRVDVYTDDPIDERDLVSYARIVRGLASEITGIGAAALRSLH